jgi:acetylcholinesterase
VTVISGNQTFGFSPDYKRIAALITDLQFHSQRRLFQQLAAGAGVPTYGYHFVDPQTYQYPASYGGACGFSPLRAFADARAAVTHGSDILYVFGSCAAKPAASQALCATIMNYWISFATSLSPNDGHGAARPQWDLYSTANPAVLQLNSTGTAMIPDTYRQEQIAFINSHALVFHHRSEE